MKTKNRLVSVIINCYNGSKYLNTAIESVLAQTYDNWELIIWDNISTDESVKIANKYSYFNPKIKVYISSHHTNLYHARNLAITKSLGEVITFLDVDDYWYPFKLQEQMIILNKNDVNLVYTNYDLLYEKNNKKIKAFNYQLPQGYITDFLLKKYCVGILTVAFNRTILNKHNSFDNQYHMIGDFDFILKYSIKNNIYVINNSTAVYRIHDQNESFLKRGLRAKEIFNWYNENYKTFSRYENFRLVYYDAIYAMAVDNLIKSNKKDALKLLFKLKFSFRYFKLYIAIFIPSFILKYLLNLS